MHKHKGLLIFGLGLLALLGITGVLIFTEGSSIAVDEAISQVAAEVDQENQEYVGDLLVTDVPYGRGMTSPEPLETDPTYGTPNAPVTIVQFGDFQCTGCADIHEPLLEVVNTYVDYVQLVWKDFPLPNQHPQAEAAAMAARCAQEQGAFWEYHDALFARQSEFLFNPWNEIAANLGLEIEEFAYCLQSERTKKYMVEGYFIARSLDLITIPTIFVNEEQLTGTLTKEDLELAIQEELDALGIDYSSVLEDAEEESEATTNETTEE